MGASHVHMVTLCSEVPPLKGARQRRTGGGTTHRKSVKVEECSACRFCWTRVVYAALTWSAVRADAGRLTTNHPTLLSVSTEAPEGSPRLADPTDTVA